MRDPATYRANRPSKNSGRGALKRRKLWLFTPPKAFSLPSGKIFRGYGLKERTKRRTRAYMKKDLA